MAKFYTYTFIVMGLAVLFWITGTNTLMTYSVGIINQLISGQFGSWVIGGALVLLAGTFVFSGIIPGLTTFSKTDLAITAGIAIVFIAFVSDFVSIITYTYSITHDASGQSNEYVWVLDVIYLLMIPAAVGYMVSLYDWSRGAYN